MFETKIRKVGNSAVVTLSSEILSAMDVKEGDTVFLSRTDDGGVRLLAHNPELAEALNAAEIVMDENQFISSTTGK
jgi:antitoxin ChpS